MGHPVDQHVGSRVRQRRHELGITQQVLASKLGVTFQQVQKYELGLNRVSASRLWHVARILEVPVAFFFEGLEGAPGTGAQPVPDEEALSLLRSFSAISEPKRRRLLDLARCLSEPSV
ncbi:helix-turn-helix domain-containing protein [Rhodobaculum claviforme]|uniref:Transcriptional regulator n=1 Tax=Rhodobaculum claviforme TaxID=1549854 RepID=A0A934TMI6_9RHOB|nr:helix-turn-helix transcriptional regulator [Rhodobaculum claviforme]MBK5928284.1 transcriptional regulator [Rhodobaculum claviforme]